MECVKCGSKQRGIPHPSGTCRACRGLDRIEIERSVKRLEKRSKVVPIPAKADGDPCDECSKTPDECKVSCPVIPDAHVPGERRA